MLERLDFNVQSSDDTTRLGHTSFSMPTRRPLANLEHSTLVAEPVVVFTRKCGGRLGKDLGNVKLGFTKSHNARRQFFWRKADDGLLGAHEIVGAFLGQTRHFTEGQGFFLAQPLVAQFLGKIRPACS